MPYEPYEPQVFAFRFHGTAEAKPNPGNEMSPEAGEGPTPQPLTSSAKSADAPATPPNAQPSPAVSPKAPPSEEKIVAILNSKSGEIAHEIQQEAGSLFGPFFAPNMPVTVRAEIRFYPGYSPFALEGLVAIVAPIVTPIAVKAGKQMLEMTAGAAVRTFGGALSLAETAVQKGLQRFFAGDKKPSELKNVNISPPRINITPEFISTPVPPSEATPQPPNIPAPQGGAGSQPPDIQKQQPTTLQITGPIRVELSQSPPEATTKREETSHPNTDRQANQPVVPAHITWLVAAITVLLAILLIVEISRFFIR